MKKHEDFTMREWRDYYTRLAQKAENNYQMCGEPRFERERIKYEAIVSAFNGYLEHKDEADTAKARRQHNIDEYCKQHLYKDSYSKAEVSRIIGVIREF